MCNWAYDSLIAAGRNQYLKQQTKLMAYKVWARPLPKRKQSFMTQRK